MFPRPATTATPEPRSRQRFSRPSAALTPPSRETPATSGVVALPGTILVIPKPRPFGVPIVFRNYVSEVPVFSVALNTDGIWNRHLQQQLGRHRRAEDRGWRIRHRGVTARVTTSFSTTTFHWAIEAALTSNMPRPPTDQGNKGLRQRSNQLAARGRESGWRVSVSGVTIDDGSDTTSWKATTSTGIMARGIVLGKARCAISASQRHCGQLG